MSLVEVAAVDAMIARGGSYHPRWGWHDDHRAADGTAGYLPALMQVRSEFAALLAAINALPRRAAALQLGMGNCRASHDVWIEVFGMAVTIDLGVAAFGDLGGNNWESFPGMSTHDPLALDFAAGRGPYDFLFIDAGHSEDDVRRDHADYAPLVRPGGLVAFHDSLPRAAYPEVGVWRHLAGVPGLTTVGDEVGTSWLIRA